MCVVSRAVRPAGELLRFVLDPDGTLTPDLKRRLPGRGVYITATRATFDQAVRKKAFARALKRPVTVPTELGSLIDGLFERHALDMLSFANKAGLVAPGTAKALKGLETGKVVALLHAAEAAEDGLRKFAQATRRLGDMFGPRLVRNFTSAQLDLALGRASVIHAAIFAGAACDGFLDRVSALENWRTGGISEAESNTAPGEPTDGAFADDGRSDPATDGAVDFDVGKPE